MSEGIGELEELPELPETGSVKLPDDYKSPREAEAKGKGKKAKKRGKGKALSIRYNSPVILTFVFLSALVLILNDLSKNAIVPAWFTAPGQGEFQVNSARCWIELFSHSLGHANWNHLVSNLLLILIVGPMLEEYYGAAEMIFMMLVTAFVSGLANILISPARLLGASDIVFMLILLASFTNFRKGEVPLTFILVLLLYVGNEVLQAADAKLNPQKADNVAHIAHIIGGFCGSIFGFFKPSSAPRPKKNAPEPVPPPLGI